MIVKTYSVVLVFMFFMFIVVFSFVNNMNDKNYREMSIEIIRELNSSTIDSIRITPIGQEVDSLVILVTDERAIQKFVNDLKMINDYSGDFGKITGSVFKYRMNFYENGLSIFDSILLFKESSAAIFVDMKDDETRYSLNNIVPHDLLKKNFEHLKGK